MNHFQFVSCIFIWVGFFSALGLGAIMSISIIRRGNRDLEKCMDDLKRYKTRLHDCQTQLEQAKADYLMIMEQKDDLLSDIKFFTTKLDKLQITLSEVKEQ